MTNAEKDRLTAELIMGWVRHPYYTPWFVWANEDGSGLAAPYKGDWHPTTSIEQAFMVVEKMIADGYTFCLYHFVGPKVWVCKFMKIDEWRTESYDSPADAIVTAALQAAQG